MLTVERRCILCDSDLSHGPGPLCGPCTILYAAETPARKRRAVLNARTLRRRGIARLQHYRPTGTETRLEVIDRALLDVRDCRPGEAVVDMARWIDTYLKRWERARSGRRRNG